jgi:uncharacterized membrane protein
MNMILLKKTLCHKFLSAEGEKLLNDSKVRDHVKEMLRHLQLEDEQWVGAHVKSAGDDEVREHPCLEVFLQNHVMEELCSRAKRDKPRYLKLLSVCLCALIVWWVQGMFALCLGDCYFCAASFAISIAPASNRAYITVPVDCECL